MWRRPCLWGGVLVHFNHRRVKLQKLLDHRNRILTAIRKINQLIAREKVPNRLLDEACCLLVKTRDIYNAWIVLTTDGRPKKPFFHTGFDGGFVPMYDRLLTGDPPACAKAALTSGIVQVKNNPSIQCLDCPLVSLYAGRAGLCLRMEHAGSVFGWLCLSCPVEFAQNVEEHDLLAELVDDIAFAL